MAVNFPLKLLAVGKPNTQSVTQGTTPGLYLRWFVQPYLGVVGISPLHTDRVRGEDSIRDSGFRLFFNSEHHDIPLPQPLMLDPLLPANLVGKARDVRRRPSWKAFYHVGGTPHLQLDLAQYYANPICYLCFGYWLFQGQELTLEYELFNHRTQATARRRVPLHFLPLTGNLGRDQFVESAYAIQVDDPDESIVRVSFISDGCLVVGDFAFADQAGSAFYTWSPRGGDGLWQEVDPHTYLFAELRNSLIQPAPPDQLVRALSEFYQTYYGIAPQHSDPNRISFLHLQLPQFQLAEPLVREYLADQYAQLCRGQLQHGRQRAYISPQEAVTLAANDPAIAYLAGLYRVLRWDENTRRSGVYKVQGEWPDGRRYASYCRFQPELALVEPRISACAAAAIKAQEVLRDYATFRVHHPVNATQVSWNLVPCPAPPVPPEVWFDPAAYLIFREKSPYGQQTPLSTFFMPRVQDVSNYQGHFLDWYDRYPGTDINKVLDGHYRYYLAGLDVFGQLSDFVSAQTTVKPAPLYFGDIQRPQITLVDPTSAEPAKHPVDIPLEVERRDSGYGLRSYDTDNLCFVFSYFWPLESRYVWTQNRATQVPSLEYFKLLYLTDTPLFTPVQFRIDSNTAAGLQVSLEQVRGASGSIQWRNSDLYQLLTDLGAADSTGQLVPSIVTAALVGGRLSFSRDFEITQATLSLVTGTITLQLMPMQASEKDRVQVQGYWLPLSAEERSSNLVRGRLYWNPQAVHNGGRLGWQTLNAAGERILPSQVVHYEGVLAVGLQTPNNAPQLPQDLEPDIGLLAHPSPQSSAEVVKEGYHFWLHVPATHILSQHERLLFTPLDPASNLEPGEYPKAEHPYAGEIDLPNSVHLLFSADRIFSFYAVRVSDDPQHPGVAIYRGEPLPFVSTANNTTQEYLLFPDLQHTHWLVVPPNQVVKQVPLSSQPCKGPLIILAERECAQSTHATGACH